MQTTARERSHGERELIGCKNIKDSNFVNNTKERQQQRVTWHLPDLCLNMNVITAQGLIMKKEGVSHEDRG